MTDRFKDTPCWYAKDYADGWIKYYDQANAIAYAKDTGCLLIYSHNGKAPEPMPATESEQLRKERDDAASKYVKQCIEMAKCRIERDELQAKLDKAIDALQEVCGMGGTMPFLRARTTLEEIE